MAYTVTQICNMALSLIGERQISSYDDSTGTVADQLRTVYPICVQKILESHPWNFAMQAEALALLDDETYPGWEYVYAYPTSALTVLRLTDETDTYKASNSPVEFVPRKAILTSQRIICTDLEDAWAEYIIDLTEPSLYTTSFIEALTPEIASKICYKITGDANRSAQMPVLAKAALDAAKLKNASEGRATPIKSTGYLDAR